MIYALIYQAPSFKGIRFAEFKDKPTAMAYVRELPEDFAAFTLDNQEDLGKKLTWGLMIKIYNVVQDGPAIKRFETTAIGCRRLWSLLMSKVERVALNDAKAGETVKVVVGKTKVKAQLTQKIRLLVKENPKKPASEAWKIFALYRDGMTVEEFIKAGGKHLKWDIDHGFVKLES